MARIYQPRQRESDKKWDMTVSSDDEGWCHAVGYCREWPYRGVDPKMAEISPQFEIDYEREMKEALPHRDKYHTHGHETAAEASKCWREYQLDNELRFYEDDDEKKRCEVCQEWTGGRADVGWEHHILCKEHQTREHYASITEKAK